MLMIFCHDCVLTAETDMLNDKLDDSQYSGVKNTGERMTPAEVQEALIAYRAALQKETEERRAYKDSMLY